MKYITQDDTVFTDREEAEEHEARLTEIAERHDEIERFLKETCKDKTDRSHKFYRRVIREWLVWQASQ